MHTSSVEQPNSMPPIFTLARDIATANRTMHIDTSIVEVSLLTEAERNWLNAYNQRVYTTLSPRLPADIAAWLYEKTRPI